MPIYQTTTFGFDDVSSALDCFTFKDTESFVYTRGRNPNSIQLGGEKISYLEGIELIAQSPGTAANELVDAYITSSGMGAINAAVLSRMKQGDVALVAEQHLWRYAYFLGRDRPSFRYFSALCQ